VRFMTLLTFTGLILARCEIMCGDRRPQGAVLAKSCTSPIALPELRRNRAQYCVPKQARSDSPTLPTMVANQLTAYFCRLPNSFRAATSRGAVRSPNLKVLVHGPRKPRNGCWPRCDRTCVILSSLNALVNNVKLLMPTVSRNSLAPRAGRPHIVYGQTPDC